ncbi:MAG: formylglycine-generating enzyme family protein [Candidatus Brocadiia bacterium]
MQHRIRWASGLLAVLAASLLVSCGGDDEAAGKKVETVEAVETEHEGEVVTNSIGMKFRRIEAGTFTMGTDEGEADEAPAHEVTISKPFYMGVHEVTQAQYGKVVGRNPSRFEGDNRPVEMVSWNDAKAFCAKLSEMDPSGSYRLPTEAEWEYACRAGTTTRFYWGDEFDPACAWVYKRDEGTNEVGQLEPNDWGLYDMSGNVWELCEDYYAFSYAGAKKIDPQGPSEGTGRVLRGGSWYYKADSARSANRRAHAAEREDGDAGLRVIYMPEE